MVSAKPATSRRPPTGGPGVGETGSRRGKVGGVEVRRTASGPRPWRLRGQGALATSSDQAAALSDRRQTTVLLIIRPDERPPSRLVTAPAGNEGSGSAVIPTQDLEAEPDGNPVRPLAALFALGPAEAELVLTLAAGARLETPVDRRRMTPDAIRCQPGSESAETGARSPPEHLTVVLSIPQPAAPASEGV